MTLSPSQLAVARLLAEGKTPREIGATLRLTVLTVRTYIRNGAKRIPGPGRSQYRLIRWVSTHGDNSVTG